MHGYSAIIDTYTLVVSSSSLYKVGMATLPLLPSQRPWTWTRLPSGGRAGGRQALSGQAGACCHSLCPVMRRAGEAARVSRRARAGASQPPDGVALRTSPARTQPWSHMACRPGGWPPAKASIPFQARGGRRGKNPRPLVRVRLTPLPPARLLLDCSCGGRQPSPAERRGVAAPLGVSWGGAVAGMEWIVVVVIGSIYR